eukprot:jgi/Botrbrau1/5202/Bobra.0172s0070.2
MSALLPKDEVFANDLVEHPRNPGSYGLIWRVAGDTEDELSEEYSEEESIQEQKLADGLAEVSWLDEAVQDFTMTTASKSTPFEIFSCEGLKVVDRALHISDIVAHRDNPVGQMGVVKDVSRLVDLRLSNGKLLKGVPSTVLKPIVPFCPEQYVIYENWLARVHSIWEAMQVRLTDGTLLQVYGTSDTQVLTPASPIDHHFNDDTTCRWYPGQRVLLLSTLSQLRHSKSVEILRKGSGRGGRSLSGVVINVQADDLEVDWINPLPGAVSNTHPPVNGNNIRASRTVPLTAFCFGPTTWYLGCRGLFVPDEATPELEKMTPEPDDTTQAANSIIPSCKKNGARRSQSTMTDPIQGSETVIGLDAMGTSNDDQHPDTATSAQMENTGQASGQATSSRAGPEQGGCGDSIHQKERSAGVGQGNAWGIEEQVVSLDVEGGVIGARCCSGQWFGQEDSAKGEAQTELLKPDHQEGNQQPPDGGDSFQNLHLLATKAAEELNAAPQSSQSQCVLTSSCPNAFGHSRTHLRTALSMHDHIHVEFT